MEADVLVDHNVISEIDEYIWKDLGLAFFFFSFLFVTCSLPCNSKNNTD